MPSKSSSGGRTVKGSWLTQAILPERERMVDRAVKKQDFAYFGAPALQRHGIIVETAASPFGESLSVVFPSQKYNMKKFHDNLVSRITELPQLSRLMRFLESRKYPAERKEREKSRLFHLAAVSREQGYVRIGKRQYFVVANLGGNPPSVSVDFYKTTLIRKMPKKIGDLTASASIYFNAKGENKTRVVIENPMREEALPLMQFLLHDAFVPQK